MSDPFREKAESSPLDCLNTDQNKSSDLKSKTVGVSLFTPSISLRTVPS